MNNLSRLHSGRGLARIGVVVPMSNSNLEPDMYSMLPNGVTVHFVRAGGYDLDKVPDSEQMRQFAEGALDEILQPLVAVRPHILVYGCTSATLSHGPAYDQNFVQRMEAIADTPSVTAAGALVETLKDLGLNKVDFASPYTEQLNKEGADFLAQSGMVIENINYVGSDLGNYGQSELSPEEILKLGREANSEGSEAVVMSCTDMRALEVVDILESEINKPVVTSNLALIYVALKRLGLYTKLPGRVGQMFKEN